MNNASNKAHFYLLIVLIFAVTACTFSTAGDSGDMALDVEQQVEATMQAIQNQDPGVTAEPGQIITGDTSPSPGPVLSLEDIRLPEVVLGPDTIVQKIQVQPLTAEELDNLFTLNTEGDAEYHAVQAEPAAYDAELLYQVISQAVVLEIEDDCGSKIIEADLASEIPGTEQYAMVSLLDCNGVNYVTPVKNQVKGTCGTYAETAAMEINLARFLLPRLARPVTSDHPIDDFSPINLSEGYRSYAAKISPNSTPVIFAPQERVWFGATLNEFYPDSEHNPYGDWSPYKADALENHYGSISPYCVDMQEQPGDDNYQRLADITRCLFDVAKQKQYPFLDYDYRADRIYLGDVRDFSTIEENVRIAISTGHPVVVQSLWWFWDGSQSKMVRNDATTGTPLSPYYQFVLLQPRPEADYEKDDQGNVKLPYTVKDSSAHVVVIVGYLHGTQGNDFWIIKNSHGERDQIRGKDNFLLVRTPNTSGPATDPDSTIRNFYKASFYIQDNWKFYQLTPNTNNTDQILANSDSSLATHDIDGDTVIDWYDNCPTVWNIDQADGDQDFVGNACDACPERYDRYQDKSNPNLVLDDQDKDGIPFRCDYDSPYMYGGRYLVPKGGELRWQAGTFRYDFWYNNWILGIEDQILGVGKFENMFGEGILIRNSGAMGVLFLNDTRMEGYGKIRFEDGAGDKEEHKIGDWLLEKTDQVVGVGSFYPDPGSRYTKDHVILFHPDKGFAFITLADLDTWDALAVYEIGDMIGNWRVGPQDKIEALGDFNGDDREDILIQSSDKLGILSVNDNGVFYDILIFSQGDMVGDWHYGAGGSFSDKFVGVGDFYGLGADQILVQNKNQLGILRLARNTLRSITVLSEGTRLGSWAYGAANQVVGTGEFNNDNREEFMLQSGWGIGIITINSLDNQLYDLRMAPYGQSLGGWQLTPEDEILYLGDFNKDGGADFVIRNDSGFAIITIAPQDQLMPLYIIPNGERVGGWYYQTFNDLVFGEFSIPGESGIFIRAYRP